MIKFNNPFTAEGEWLKGNLHAHTSETDGQLSPDEVAKLYRENGYDFLGIADHNKVVIPNKLDEMIYIPCEEIDIPLLMQSDNVPRWIHLVAVNISQGLELSPEQKADLKPKDVIEMINQRGGEAILAHPYWSNLTVNEMLLAEGCIGLEVYNTYFQNLLDAGLAYVHWDQIIQKNVPMFGFACDDAHRYSETDDCFSDACGGWIMVRAEKLTSDDIFESVRKGFFYSTNGPEIKSVVIEGNKIYVETSPVKSISFKGYDTQSKYCYRKDGGNIESASYEFDEHKIYVRIQCVDSNGNMAWTNPICFG